MKINKLVIGSVLAIAALVVILIAIPFIFNKPIRAKAPAPKTPKIMARAPIKKAISKGKGALLVKIADSRKKEMPLRIRAFKSQGSRSSIYTATFTANRAQELPAGTYDIEIDTAPQKLYKNVRVAEGRENIEDIGSVTGSINIKALNAKKLAGSYPVRIAYSKSNDTAAVTTTNKPIEILPGAYDIEVGTLPRQIKTDVKVEAGREAVLDLGCTTGALLVKAFDDAKKEARYSVRITKSANDEFVGTTTTNRPVELLKGIYNVDVLSNPRQTQRDLRVNEGEETGVEFLVQAPKAAAPMPPRAIKK